MIHELVLMRNPSDTLSIPLPDPAYKVMRSAKKKLNSYVAMIIWPDTRRKVKNVVSDSGCFAPNPYTLSIPHASILLTKECD